MTGCPFCDIIRTHAYDDALSEPGVAAVFEPIVPHSPGHLLVVPWRHVRDAAEDPAVTGQTAAVAARIIGSLGYEGANLLTSVGETATQSVFHLHWHIIPRWGGDALLPRWPWQCGAIHDEHTKLPDYPALRRAMVSQ